VSLVTEVVVCWCNLQKHLTKEVVVVVMNDQEVEEE
jgi:hypothetical protein